MRKINASLTISRPSGAGDEVIRIAIMDETSRARFVELEIGLADFTSVLTGLSEVKCNGTVRNLEVVGKRKVQEKRSLLYTGDYCKRSELEEWLSENGKEEGWEVDTYLGTQTSVVYQQDGSSYMLNYRVFRYEDVEPE